MGDELVASYLYARDPSILAYNKTKLDAVKRKLDSAMANSSDSTVPNEDVSSDSTVPSEEEDKYINVYLRIKGDAVICTDIYEICDDALICKVPENSHNSRNMKLGDQMTKSYSFTSIFGPEVTQTQIFNEIVKPKLLSFIQARNSTLFTYGASGSGKTFTIVGTPEQPGLIPRALEYIFRSIPKVNKKPEIKPLPNGDTKEVNEEIRLTLERDKSYIINASLIDQAAHIKTYKQMQERLSSEPIAEVEDNSTDVSLSIWISFAEIYNETIFDLLAPPSPQRQRQKLTLGKTKDENTYIKNLTCVNVSDGLEAYQILQYGLHNLNYASTAINSHSSRSHCIFTIKLVQSSKSNSDIYISNFNFCDLAGAERLKKTMNYGDRLKESNNINTSLLVLGRCMENIRKYQQVKDNRLIPFRESKLTQIFQRALMGLERVNMIVNISPAKDMFDETVHVLNFSAIAKTVLVEEQPLKAIRKKTRFSMMMDKENVGKNNFNNFSKDNNELKKLRIENERLRGELKARSAAYNDEDKDENELELLRRENRILNDAVDQIIEERDKIIAIYEKKIIDEKEYIANLYKGSIARREKTHIQQILRLREEYELKLANADVINISSSSSDFDDENESPPKRIKIMDRQQLDRITELEEENRQLKEALMDKNELLEEAKEEYLLLTAENESYRQRFEEK